MSEGAAVITHDYHPHVRYQRVEGVLHQVVDRRAMLIAPAGEEVIVLNATGSAVWDALADPAGCDTDALVEQLATAFPSVATDVLSADVDAFLAELLGAGLVVRA